METVGVCDQGSGDSGAETTYSQVVRGPCAEAGDSGMGTGDAQVSRGTHVSAGAVKMAGVGASVWDDGG